VFVTIKNVSKWFGDVIALNNISIDLEHGAIGLVGLNGAGKTTLIKILNGLLKPTEGTVKIYGQNVWGNLDLFSKIGYCPEIDNQMNYLTGLKFVQYNLQLHGYSRQEAIRKAQDVLERLNMTTAMTRKIKGYSRGMRQRVKVAQAIAHDPAILLLDEPLQGLDPIGRYELTTLFNELIKEGKDLIVSSHVLHELEKVSQTIVFIDHGKILGKSNISDLRATLKEIPQRFLIKTDKPVKLAQQLLPYKLIDDVQLKDNEIIIGVKNVQEFSFKLIEVAKETHAEIKELRPLDESLEAVFDYIYRGNY